MSFYRSILAAAAALVIASPVFADDAANAQNPADNSNNTPAVQTADNSSAAATDQQGAASTSEQIKININKASAKDLMKVKGLNASKAKAIVAYRKKHGDFKSIEDLNNVKGFKKVKPEALKEIQDQLSVE